MSELVFPQLPGMAWGLSRVPMWNTRVQRSVSGTRQAVSYMSYPLYKYTINFNILRAVSTNNELATLQGFFNKMRGQLDTFLFVDPNDASVLSTAPQSLGNGDGVKTDFQLLRTYGGFVEPVHSPNLVQMRKNGVIAAFPSEWTHIGNGIIRFTPAPTLGHPVDWNGTFWWRCAFTQDTLELINGDGIDIWKSGKISFETVKP